MILLSNCPNCGAPLRSDGYCENCKTEIRYANHIEIFNEWEELRNNVELLIKMKRGDGTTLLAPLRGRLLEISINPDPHFKMNPPEVTVRLEGYWDKILETKVKGSQ